MNGRRGCAVAQAGVDTAQKACYNTFIKSINVNVFQKVSHKAAAGVKKEKNRHEKSDYDHGS